MEVSLFWNEKKEAWAIRGHDPRLQGLDNGVIGLGWKVILKNVTFKVGQAAHKKAVTNLITGNANIRHAEIKGELVYWLGASDHYNFLQQALQEKSPYIWTNDADRMEKGLQSTGAPVRYHPQMGDSFLCMNSVHALTGLPIHEADFVVVGLKQPWIWTSFEDANNAEEVNRINARKLLAEILPKPEVRAAKTKRASAQKPKASIHKSKTSRKK